MGEKKRGRPRKAYNTGYLLLCKKEAVELSEFEKLLNRLKVQEREAHMNLQVRDWVRRYYRSRFVPMDVLEKMGIKDPIQEGI